MTATPLSSPASKPRRSHRPNWLLWGGIALLIAIVAASVWFFFLRGDSSASAYRTEAVQQGDITRSVSASGTLEALVTVEVGS